MGQIHNIYIDEAGRGPLAGPLYVGLVIPIQKLSKSTISRLNIKDSKLLNEKQREIALKGIQKLEQKNKILTSFGYVHAHEIDQHGLTKSINIAILRSFKIILEKIYKTYFTDKLTGSLCGYDHIHHMTIQNYINTSDLDLTYFKNRINIYSKYNQTFRFIIDGNRTFGLDKDLDIPVETIIDGDFLIPEISMASIIAKVTRDHVMIELHKLYPQYNLDKHKGYGTENHRNLIKKHGPSEIHRKLFLKDYFPEFQTKSKKSPSKRRKKTT